MEDTGKELKHTKDECIIVDGLESEEQNNNSRDILGAGGTSCNDIIMTQESTATKQKGQANQHDGRVVPANSRFDDILVAAYACALVGFLATYHTASLPKLPFPVMGHLMDWDPNKIPLGWWEHDALLVLMMWSWMYCRKTCLLIIWRYCSTKPKETPPININSTVTDVRLEGGESNTDTVKLEKDETQNECCKIARYISVIVFHCLAGLWMGWANNFHLGYVPSDLEISLAGCGLFAFTEMIISISYVYVMVKHRRYMGPLWICILETLNITGLALVSFTLPVFLLVFVVIVVGVHNAVKSN